MNIAGSVRRTIAYLFDELISSFLYLPIFIKILLLSFTPVGDAVSEDFILSWKWVLVSVFLVFIYEVVFLKMVGAMPAQLLLGLRVIPLESESPERKELSWGQSLLRVVADKFKYLVGFSGALLALTNSQRKTLSDYIAETKVIQLEPRAEALKSYSMVYVLVILSLVLGLYNAIETARGLRFNGEGILVESIFNDEAE